MLWKGNVYLRILKKKKIQRLYNKIMKDRIRGKNKIKKNMQRYREIITVQISTIFFFFLLNHKIIKDKI